MHGQVVLIGILACVVAGLSAQPADLCDINNPQLLPSACDLECRRQILTALTGIFNKLNGSEWDFAVGQADDEQEGNAAKERDDKGNWTDCSITCTAEDAYGVAGNKSIVPAYCCWQGVYCCNEQSSFTRLDPGRENCSLFSVRVLQPRSGHLSGPLAGVMRELETLHSYGMAHLDMSRNFITGTIPEEIGRLSSLHTLLLGSNNLTGTVPLSLGQLLNLMQLDLEFNWLTGSIHQQLCQDDDNHLEALYIRANNFTGPLNLTRCNRLQLADIQENGFTGTLPVNDNNLYLSVLRARNNDFDGPVPDVLWSLPQLTMFDVTNNSLTGTLPQAVASTNFLTTLKLGSNNLSGTVPVGISTSTQLTTLDLSDNPYLEGTLPEMTWMLGLQYLSISNTRISGTIPEGLAGLPYLTSVDLHNTLMTCCQTAEQARLSLINNALLPTFLTFNSMNQRPPDERSLGRDPEFNMFQETGSNMLCDTVKRTPQHDIVQHTVSRPANLSGQQWVVDPEYFWFLRCNCNKGFLGSDDNTTDLAFWCNTTSAYSHSNFWQCINMTVLTCTPLANKGPLSQGEIVGVSLGTAAGFLLLLMLTSIALNQCFTRAGKIRRQLYWWKKHLAGMPCAGKMSIVVTDIEGYSDLFKRCPELMYKALTLHNNVIRKAKYTNCGSTVQQEGDSYTLVFHDAFDAVGFCLQAQLALMEVAWPEGLIEHQDITPERKDSKSNRGSRRLKLGQLEGMSSLLTGPSVWLRNRSKAPQPMKTVGSHAALPVHSTATTADLMLATTSAAPSGSLLPVNGRGATLSRTRMLDLFRQQPVQQAVSGAGLFTGLRVRMGIVTGQVEESMEPGATAFANIMNSSLYKLALDVSDAGNGGQIVMDDTTFQRIKEDLHPLGAVDSGGLNYGKLAQRRSVWHLLCLGYLCSRSSEMLDVDEAVVLDMGEYNVSSLPPKLPSLAKQANNMLRASMKIFTPHRHELLAAMQQLPLFGQQQQQHQDGKCACTSHLTPDSRITPGGVETAPEPFAAAAAAGGYASNAHDRGSSDGADDGPVHNGGLPAPLQRLQLAQHDSYVSAGTGGTDGQPTFVQQTSVLPGAIPLEYYGCVPGTDYGYGFQNAAGDARQPPAAAAGGPALTATQQWQGFSNAADTTPGGQRVRLLQILSPSLVGRAHVWGNNLSIKNTWVSTDAPYFEAPGTKEAPLGTNVVHSSSTNGRHVPLPPSNRHTAALAAAQQQWPNGMSAAAAGPIVQLVGVTPSDSVGDSGAGASFTTGQIAVLRAASSSSAPAKIASGLESSQQQQQQVVDTADHIEVVIGGRTSSDTTPQQQLQQQQQQQQSPGPVQQSALRPSDSSSQQGNLASGSAPFTDLIAASASPYSPLVPPVTMVFMVVDGAKVFGQRRRQLLKEVHAQLSLLLMEALRHLPGGYLCRMQEGELKYMIAFGSAQCALEWCLLVQEAAMYLNWPDDRWQRIPQLRSEYDAAGQLVFRGPRLKMGVCEGIPRTIIPDHMGRADYHGSSINQAARYMDAGAHGGQIACEGELAYAVLRQWASQSSNGDSGGSSKAAAVSHSCSTQAVNMLPAVSPSGDYGDPVVRAKSAPAVIPATDSGMSSAAVEAAVHGTGDNVAMQAPGDNGAVADSIFATVPGVLLLDSSAAAAVVSQKHHQVMAIIDELPGLSSADVLSNLSYQQQQWLQLQQQQQQQGQQLQQQQDTTQQQQKLDLPQQQQQEQPGQLLSSQSSKALHKSGANKSGPFSLLSHMFSSIHSRLLSSTANNTAPVASAVGGSGAQQLSEQQLAVMHASHQHTSAAEVAGAQSSSPAGGSHVNKQQQRQQRQQQHQQQQVLAVFQAPAATTAPAPRMFGLTNIPTSPVQVHIHYLGSFKFKGNPQPLDMVNVMLASLAGRNSYFPSEAPKGKGGRVAARSGLAAAGVAPLPTLAQQYRARVPRHILERVVHRSGSGSPQLSSARLRTASLPVQRSQHSVSGSSGPGSVGRLMSIQAMRFLPRTASSGSGGADCQQWQQLQPLGNNAVAAFGPPVQTAANSEHQYGTGGHSPGAGVDSGNNGSSMHKGLTALHGLGLRSHSAVMTRQKPSISSPCGPALPPTASIPMDAAITAGQPPLMNTRVPEVHDTDADVAPRAAFVSADKLALQVVIPLTALQESDVGSVRATKRSSGGGSDRGASSGGRALVTGKEHKKALLREQPDTDQAANGIDL